MDNNNTTTGKKRPWVISPDMFFEMTTARLKQSCHVLNENVVRTGDDLDLSQVPGVTADHIEGIIASGLLHTYSQQYLSKFPNLKVVSLTSRGSDYIDVQHLQSRNIAIGCQDEAMVVSVAEFVFTLMLGSSRRLPEGIELWKGGRCDDFQAVIGQNISGKTLGIVGIGSIGTLVAKKASAFDMKVVYHTRSQRSADEEKALNLTYHPTLSSLLKESDFVVLTVPLTAETTKMMGEEQFKLMKSTATLINVARGGVVDQDALVHALRTKEIRAAALDTVIPEPLPRDHPLMHMQNVIVTPHMAWATEETQKQLDDCIINNLMAGLRGESLPNPIPRL